MLWRQSSQRKSPSTLKKRVWKSEVTNDEHAYMNPVKCSGTTALGPAHLPIKLQFSSHVAIRNIHTAHITNYTYILNMNFKTLNSVDSLQHLGWWLILIQNFECGTRLQALEWVKKRWTGRAQCKTTILL